MIQIQRTVMYANIDMILNTVILKLKSTTKVIKLSRLLPPFEVLTEPPNLFKNFSKK